MLSARLVAVVCFSACFSALVNAETVLVTGATGRTGALAYAQLKDAGFDVRGFVMNASQAKDILHCGDCTEKEGIYVGDVTKPDTLVSAMANVDRLVITVGAAPHCGIQYLGCKYSEGAYPKDIDWLGTKNQVLAAKAAGAKHVVLVSAMGTTTPDTFLDKMGHGWDLFYKLNAEAFLMNSGLAYTIVKPGGLTMDAGGKKLYVGHEDNFNGTKSNEVARADVAAVLTEACKTPTLAANTRFDLVADPKQAGTGDYQAFWAAAKLDE